jgi:hypothetical protein
MRDIRGFISSSIRTTITKGGTVSQKRLVIDLSEIIHLEINCGFCGKPSILPLEEQEQSKIQIGPGTRVSLNACPS